LLNNPPSAHASSSVAKQWRHDVDQLVVAAINTPHHEGGQQEPAAAHSRSFIQRFSQVHNTISRISNASVVVAFR
jgi:hypothetical protein